MNTGLLIATLLTLLAGTLLLRFYFNRISPRLWLLGPALLVLLFTVISAGVIKHSNETTSRPAEQPSVTAQMGPSTPAAQLSDTVHQALGEGFRNGIPKVLGIDVIQYQGSFHISVSFSIDAGSLGEPERESAVADTYNVARALYQSNIPVARLNMTGIFFPPEDRYGLKKEAVVLEMSLSQATVADIEWNTIRHNELLSMCDTLWLHPSVLGGNGQNRLREMQFYDDFVLYFG
jgi:hypothetical protein